MIKFRNDILFHKYLKNNLKALIKTYYLFKKKGYVKEEEIEEYLERKKTHIYNILKSLEDDELIERDEKHGFLRYYITENGDSLVKRIIKELRSNKIFKRI